MSTPTSGRDSIQTMWCFSGKCLCTWRVHLPAIPGSAVNDVAVNVDVQGKWLWPDVLSPSIFVTAVHNADVVFQLNAYRLMFSYL